jgi:hypothetical protein
MRKRCGSDKPQQSAAAKRDLSLGEPSGRQTAADRSSCSRLTSRRSPVRAGHRPFTARRLHGVLGILMSVATEHLSPAARAFRAAHGAITVAFLAAIVYVWWCAITRRRDRWLRLAVAALVTEGAFVAANHGDCPLGPLQVRFGDPVPLFELVLPPNAARRAVPALGLVTVVGLMLLARRRPAPRRRLSLPTTARVAAYADLGTAFR